MHTDEGIVGYGEPVVEGRIRTVMAQIKEFEEYLIGKDPRHIEHHWQVMYRTSFYRGGAVLTSAISGLEQAMWDILGKSLGVPVYTLLGGACRQRIRVYAHVRGETPQEMAEHAKSLVEQGFTALKTGAPGPVHIIDKPAYIDGFVARIAALREAVGNDVDIGIDFHGRLSPAMSIRCAVELEPFRPMFIEEPVLPENVDALARVANSTSIPIATGERLFTKWAFREVLEKQAAAILQPDLCHAGGILEVKKIAAMAETYFAAIAPHNPLGPISLASAIQLDACIPNFLCQEQVSLGEGYITEPFEVKDGYIDLPTKPGLGIELDDEAIEAKRFDGRWSNPKWFHEDDGSVADW